MVDDNPPPFGFWTIITTTSRKQTIVIKTTNIENVLIVTGCFVVNSLSPKFGLQRKNFFRDISKLKFRMPEWLSNISFAQDTLGQGFLSSVRHCRQVAPAPIWVSRPGAPAEFSDWPQ